MTGIDGKDLARLANFRSKVTKALQWLERARCKASAVKSRTTTFVSIARTVFGFLCHHRIHVVDRQGWPGRL